MFIAVDEKSENWPVIVLFPTAAVQSRLIAKRRKVQRKLRTIKETKRKTMMKRLHEMK